MSEKERRQGEARADRATLAMLARDALRLRVNESRAYSAQWTLASNLGWVRWEREDGRHVYCGIRRRMDWITGEIGVSTVPLELDELPLVTSLASVRTNAFRIQLGMLLHGQDKWWSSGGSEKTLLQRLDWLAQQMQMQLLSVTSSTPRI